MSRIERLLKKGRANPILFGKVLWPDVDFYREQRIMIESVRDNDETFVVAGNMLGACPLVSALPLWWVLDTRG